jgi:hypothetical protein
LRLVSITQFLAQGEAAVPFLLIAPDSRGGGIGESGAGLADNSSAVFLETLQELHSLQVRNSVSLIPTGCHNLNLIFFYDYATYRNYIEELDGSVTASVYIYELW